MEIIEQGHGAPALSRWARALYLVFFLIAFGFGETVLGMLEDKLVAVQPARPYMEILPLGL